MQWLGSLEACFTNNTVLAKPYGHLQLVKTWEPGLVSICRYVWILIRLPYRSWQQCLFVNLLQIQQSCQTHSSLTFVTNWDLLQHDQDGWFTDIMINYVLTAQGDQQRLDSLMLEKWNQVCFWVESALANHEFTKSVALLLQSFCIVHCSSCLSFSGNLVGDLQESLSMLITSPTERRTTMIPSSLFLYWPSSLVLNLVIVLPWDWVHHNWSGGFSGPSIHPLAGLFCPFPSLHCMRYSPCTSSNTNSWLGNTNRHNQIHPKKGEEVHEGSTRLHVKEDYSISANFSGKISRSTKQTPGKGTKKPGLISLQKSIEILN